jgi:hypothetical protein
MLIRFKTWSPTPTPLPWSPQPEGEASVLTRLLNKRFGPLSIDASQRLQSATPEQLDAWTDRILDAPTLAAVFAEH